MLDWHTEAMPSDDFPDLVWHSAYTRGGFPGPWFAGNEMPEGARAYHINDWTDSSDGKHFSNLQMSSVQHDGWINEDGDVVHDEDECEPASEWEETLELEEVADRMLFEGPDSLEVAKAQAEKWEGMEIEKKPEPLTR
jgi:hypothetical protein